MKEQAIVKVMAPGGALEFVQWSGKEKDKVGNVKECGMIGHPVVVARHLCCDVEFRL